MMSRMRLTLVSAALVLAATALPAFAESSASSAVSDSLSTSVGSISTSVGKSSDSSKKKDVAQGEYRVVEVAEVTGSDARVAQVRVTLHLLADDSVAGELLLTLPRAAAERGALAAGAIVAATTRPYGVEFTHGADKQPFFLVLHDAWYRELNTQPVVI